MHRANTPTMTIQIRASMPSLQRTVRAKRHRSPPRCAGFRRALGKVANCRTASGCAPQIATGLQGRLLSSGFGLRWRSRCCVHGVWTLPDRSPTTPAGNASGTGVFGCPSWRSKRSASSSHIRPELCTAGCSARVVERAPASRRRCRANGTLHTFENAGSVRDLRSIAAKCDCISKCIIV